MKSKETRQLLRTGFTLIEVMAAVAVLSIGLVGGLTVITKNLSAMYSGADRIIAANLAVEGIELVRNVRDTNWLTTGNDWDEEIKGSGNEEFVKIFFGNQANDNINPKPGNGTFEEEIDNCIGDGNCKIYFYTNGLLKYYGDDFGGSEGIYTRGGFTGFYRLIHIDNLPGSSIKVSSVVRWSEGSQNKYLTVEETLYNWKN